MRGLLLNQGFAVLEIVWKIITFQYPRRYVLGEDILNLQFILKLS